MLVTRELLGLDLGGGKAADQANGGPGVVEAGKEAYEMQATLRTGHKPINVEAEDRPPVTRDQVITIVLLTATMLFLYDGLQVGTDRQRPYCELM